MSTNEICLKVLILHMNPTYVADKVVVIVFVEVKVQDVQWVYQFVDSLWTGEVAAILVKHLELSGGKGTAPLAPAAAQIQARTTTASELRYMITANGILPQKKKTHTLSTL